ncbi:MAG TPA: serine/threonine-protein kinase, partial [Candidatus Sulfomarinibacteraceae bacterium]|nr:serine/threonine-protein kinase [Candidatus Sulfomarinibacteraceae bacterium]
SDLRTAAVDAEAAHAASDAAVVLPERWRLLELLGSGGQATVWLAEDRMLGQRVALKILRAGADERTRARWLEEVRQGRRLSHPKLIRIFDVIEASERPVAVMEFVPGGTLADRVKRGGAQPVDDVVRWAREVLEVLGYLHGQRIVHRDVKPSNLLVAEDGSIKLSDLGLVRALDRASDLTATMEGVGTPRFMAPEQLRGEPPSGACDLYSLGVTMYQLLTGRLPFDGDSAFQIADGHLHGEPAPVREYRPECPRWLARFVARLLEKDPRARYASAAEAAAALEGRRVGLPRRAWRRLAAVLAVMVAGGGAAMLLARALEGELERVEVTGAEVVARSADGRRLWSAARPGFNPVALTGNFVGDEGLEAVVGWNFRESATSIEDSAIVELRSDGGEVLRSFGTSGLGKIQFGDIAPIWKVQQLDTGRFSGEGLDLVWTLSNPRWFPGLIGVTSFREPDGRPLLIFPNSGHSLRLSAADLDGDARDELVALVLNNRIGYQTVLVTAGARSRTSGEPCTLLASPDLWVFRRGNAGVPDGCMSYTPLGSNVLAAAAPRATSTGIELVVDGQVRRFDVWGNPEGSPTYGMGGTLRATFWDDLAASSARAMLSTEAAATVDMDRLRAAHPEVMAERPSEVAAFMIAGRALASGGRRDEALELLRDGTERFPDEVDLALRLGEQLLIGGERAEGRRWLVASLSLGRSGRNHNDQIMMLSLDAAAHGDGQALDAVRDLIANLAAAVGIAEEGLLDVMWHFFQGDWQDRRLLDPPPNPTHLWQQVLRAWARFEADGDAEVALAEAGRLDEINEVRPLARTLEARVRLAGGEARTAYELADTARGDLATRCRDTYESCAWLPLAEWVGGRALVELGRADEGRELLERAAERAPNTWIAASAGP